jgi:hypothetical protein
MLPVDASNIPVDPKNADVFTPPTALLVNVVLSEPPMKLLDPPSIRQTDEPAITFWKAGEFVALILF